MGTARPLLGSALVALALLSGCGEARDATSKELSALTAEISKLRAEQAAIAGRLEALERSKAPAPTPAAAADPKPPAAAPEPVAARSLDGDRPSLDVVKLGPVPSEADGDADDDGPRTVLRSGANGIIVEETGSAAAGARTVVADPKKTAAKKTDKADRKKTASSPKQ